MVKKRSKDGKNRYDQKWSKKVKYGLVKVAANGPNGEKWHKKGHS